MLLPPPLSKECGHNRRRLPVAGWPCRRRLWQPAPRRFVRRLQLGPRRNRCQLRVRPERRLDEDGIHIYIIGTPHSPDRIMALLTARVVGACDAGRAEPWRCRPSPQVLLCRLSLTREAQRGACLSHLRDVHAPCHLGRGPRVAGDGTGHRAHGRPRSGIHPARRELPGRQAALRFAPPFLLFSLRLANKCDVQ